MPSVRIPLLASLALASFLVGGCAEPAPVGMATERSVPGTCKLLATAEEMVTSSDVSPAVPCTGPHIYETYAVAEVPASITALAQRPGPEQLQAQTVGVCPIDPIRPYLGASELDSQWGISIWSKVPTRAEWSAGVRAVTCALVVDSPVPHRAPVHTMPLAQVMRYSDSARVRQCRMATTLPYTTCDRAHSGERMGSVGVDAALTGPARERSALQSCRKRVLEYTGQKSVPGFVPEIVSTSGGAECWLTSTGDDVTGTERGGLVPR